MADVEHSAGAQTLGPAVRGAIAAGGVALAVFLIGPRAAPFLLLTLVVVTLSLSPPRALALEELRRAPMAVLLAFGLYLIANSLWSLDRIDALGKAALMLAIVICIWLARHALTRMPEDVLDRLALACLIASGLGFAYLLIEEMLQHPVKTAVFNLIPATRPSSKHILLEGEEVASVELYLSNRSMAALAFLVWPMLLLALGALRAAGASVGIRRGAAALLLLAAAATLAHSEHETSILALAASAIVAGVALWSRAAALAMAAAGWIAATLLVVPIVSQLYKQELHMNESLPKSARHRVIIWGYTAEQIPKAPLLGIGIGSGKILDAGQTHERRPGHIYPWRAGTHSHNVYLQAWYELGAIGALLLCASGLALLLAIRRLEGGLQATALATFVTSAVMASFSWGMWQPWFMASFGISALMLVIAAESWRRGAGAGR